MPSIAVLGLGPGLGRSVARRFARAGYDLALVARRADVLDAAAIDLADTGATVHRLPADLADTAAVPGLAARIRDVIGEPDVVYYGASADAFVPVRDLTPQVAAAVMPLSVYTPIALAAEFVPAMLEREDGAFLTAQGAAALHGMPMAAAGLGLAARRNYVQALAAQVQDSNVVVGGLYIGAIIEGSAYHAAYEADRAAGRPVAPFPLIDPDHLADLLFAQHRDHGPSEIVYPAERAA